jgi:hypothetical protein
MNLQIKEVKYTGLSITHYKSDNIYPLLPLLSQEFPNWTIDKIKNYVKLVITKNHDVAGMLVAQNEAAYNVGLLIYTFQSISSKLSNKNKKDDFMDGLVVENLIASSPILQKQVFFILIENVIKMAKKNNCEFVVELPKFDETYELIKQKYQKQISNINSFRPIIRFAQ